MIKYCINMIIISIFYYIFVIRDVKMGFNPWVNLAHHEVELGWIEKNSVFSKVGWTQPNSFNPRVRAGRVEGGLTHLTHQHFFTIFLFFLIIIYYS